MGRLIKFALIAGVVWAGWQVHLHGVDGTFGGALAKRQDVEMPGAEAFSNASNALGDREAATTRESYPARTIDRARDRATRGVAEGARRSGAD